VLALYRRAVKDDLLFTAHFESLPDYLWQLRMACCLLQTHASQHPPLVYLAAAVADFYMPLEDMAEHKLDSSAGPLTVRLAPTPKMLRPLVRLWSPRACVVSFKLETDSSVLLKKATNALKRYGHSLVIGNVLETRRTEVVLVSPRSADVHTPSPRGSQAGTGARRRDSDENASSAVCIPKSCIDLENIAQEFCDFEFFKISKCEESEEIENKLIEEVCKRHQLFINSKKDEGESL